ncbi:NADH-quinone oxidoreductase subunit H, partial [Acinetobacter baumannii]
MNQEIIRQTPLWAENWPIAYAVVQAVVILLVVVLVAALMSFIERRLLAWWQDRYGPNRVGPGGMFQIVADMLKIMFKEDWTPKFADKLTFRLAPAVAMATAVLSFMVIPV